VADHQVVALQVVALAAVEVEAGKLAIEKFIIFYKKKSNYK
jgi:NADH:ubiquinone oxidoreductase subunit K